ncbi:MAG: YdgA family protein [Thermodesulfobacteriota bacterium]
MRTALGMMLGAALLGGLYTGSTWFMGREIEKVIGQQYSLVATLPYLTIVQRDYRRGVFCSQETATIELFGDTMRALASTQAVSGSAVAVPERLAVTIHTRIQHGPFPGLSRLAAAVGDSDVTVPDLPQEMRQAFGDKKPVASQTVFRFDGGFSAFVHSPRAAVTLPPAPTGTAVSLLWEGFEGQIDAAPNLQQYTATGRTPRIELKEGNETRMLFSDLRFEADQKRVYEDEPFFYSGSQLFSIEEIRVENAAAARPAVTLKQLRYGVEMPDSGDILDIAGRMGVEEICVADQKWGPAHFDLAFRHLHARTMADLYHTMLAMVPQAMEVAGPSPAGAAQVFAALLEPVRTLLAHQPELVIDRLAVVGPAGEARLAARVRLPGVTPEDLDEPAMLLAKLEAAGDAAVPEALLFGMADRGAGAENAAGQQQEQVRAQLAVFSEQGYITWEGGMIKVQAELKAGRLKLNGQPFPPAAPGPEEEDLAGRPGGEGPSGP